MTDDLRTAELWIDALAKIWEFSDGALGAVHSYRVFERNEVPAAITDFPSALSFPIDLQAEYSTGGPTILIWQGTTEFHLCGDLKPSNLAYILPFYGRILGAAAGNMTLGGTVKYFQLVNGPGAIQLVRFSDPATGASHHGLKAAWTIKQNITGSITIST